MKSKSPVEKIISGGQTGADLGALLAAKELKIKTGGTAPKDYKTELGQNLLLKELGLVESTNTSYLNRTIENIKNSSGTLVLGNTNSVGSRQTILQCRKMGRPLIVNPTKQAFQTWLKWNNIQILNVAGNRESVNPGIGEKVKNFLVNAIEEIS